MASKHLLWLTFSPVGSNSFYIQQIKRETASEMFVHVQISFFNICTLLTYVGSIDKVSDCFFSPVSQFNFVGKLLGPRGNSMKRLQEETGVKMSILGKGSMRDKGKVRKISICVLIHSCLAAPTYIPQMEIFTETKRV